MQKVGKNKTKWCYQGPAAHKINTEHIYDGHHPNGKVARTKGSKKDLFPSDMTKNGIEKCVGRAWKAGRKRIKKQEIPGEDIRFLYKGTDPKTHLTLKMWYNAITKTIETAWPIEKTNGC
jgi:transcription antitermination factor NusA-like protein